MYEAYFKKITLNFKQASGTSRGILTQKDSWILHLFQSENPNLIGKGEASILTSLSPDWDSHYEEKLLEVAKNINLYLHRLDLLNAFPSIQFAIESALLDLNNGAKFILFPAIFEAPDTKIPINGLIWMGSEKFMLTQIAEKIKAGFTCIKMKIGAIDFENEINILKSIRAQYPPNEIELRVDANGAFSPDTALDKLRALSDLAIHSIEQPIKPGQREAMAALCKLTPLPIALDEELIGIYDKKEKETLLKNIKPQFIILKPSLIGGMRGTDEWIELADKYEIKWWITSALESNIGLNAIAQYTFTKNNPLPQGLGTGSLFTNNLPPFLQVKKGHLHLNLV
ncbi:o-succinylbenzoate synthase [Putridiphycobacter roseus]|uniref:O-succinylbenzoate synthase n=1 Tax=Putridiphycobacter roseus TaxID=2219161 RepID=A0A2W1NGZ0_9FLAO|nr:o-succinylbenzoate synthase [Putridiphycobacter roseus]PZE17266.1 o-succinylbenzoate synthase [Putridiphycobacter roseus]